MSGTMVKHLDVGSFSAADARGFCVRDLGIANATKGGYTATVIQATPDAKPVSDWVGEDETFFMGVLFSGSMKIEFESIGTQLLEEGDVVQSHNGERRRVLSCSDDLELFTLISNTLEVKEPKGATVQHVKDEPYAFVDQGGAGQRDHVLYRNLGVEKATGGAIGAHMGKVVKAADTSGDKAELVRQWHKHVLDFHCMYTLGDWGEFDFADIGVQRLKRGTMLYLPPEMPHAEVERIVGLEGLEITAPAKYPTEFVEEEEKKSYQAA